MADGVRQQQRRDSAADWSTSNYILAPGEIGYTEDTHIIKVGDGVTPWNSLPTVFSGTYLPKLSTAEDSKLLDGISSENFVQTANVSVPATANKVAQRDGNGRLLAAAGTSGDEVVNFDQTTNLLSANRRELVPRTVTGATTFAASDVGGMVHANNSNRNLVIQLTIPTAASVSIPMGSWIDICSIGVGTATVVPAAGVTLRGDGRCYGNYGMIRITKIGTDIWVVGNRSDPADAYARAFMYMDTNSPDLSLFWRHCPLNNEMFDTHNGHVIGAITGDDTDTTAPKQTNRYVCQPGQAGTYRVGGMVMIDQIGASTDIASRIIKNGTTMIGGHGANSRTAQCHTGQKLITMNEGDWVGLQGYSEFSGWNFWVTSGAAETSWMSVERIA